MDESDLEAFSDLELMELALNGGIRLNFNFVGATGSAALTTKCPISGFLKLSKLSERFGDNERCFFDFFLSLSLSRFSSFLLLLDLVSPVSSPSVLFCCRKLANTSKNPCPDARSDFPEDLAGSLFILVFPPFSWSSSNMFCSFLSSFQKSSTSSSSSTLAQYVSSSSPKYAGSISFFAGTAATGGAGLEREVDRDSVGGFPPAFRMAEGP